MELIGFISDNDLNETGVSCFTLLNDISTYIFFLFAWWCIDGVWCLC
jgi:hypothetical protein